MRSKSWSWIFIGFLFAALHAAGLAQAVTTQVADTIYHADGTTAAGTVLIAWPAFTAGNGQAVPAGNTSVVIGAGGALSVNLVANSGAIPIGTYYTVTYHLDDNTVTRQYWVVPQSSTPVRIAAIVSTVLPISVAMQTVSKNYVDTAIAAAVSGHLDTSALVQKAGDTMTGSLVLPADPVSSLQAATKHYVDSAVASSGGGSGGGLTGQTTGNLPLATSATASATSSRFYDNGTQTGVSSPFGAAISTAANCNFLGAGFSDKGCHTLSAYNDGSLGQHIFTAVGVGGSAGGSAGGYNGFVGSELDWGTTELGSIGMSAAVTAGLKTWLASNWNAYGIGDTEGINMVTGCAAGTAYSADEGCTNRLKIGEAEGSWNAPISGGTNTAPLFTSGGFGCGQIENQTCAPSPGTWMLDTSVVLASGAVTSMPSSGVTIGSCVMPWLSQSSTSFTPPAAAVWGCALAVNATPSAITTWDAPAATTFTLQYTTGGSFAAGDHACVIGSNFTEQQIITSVSGTSPTQSITLPLVMPEADIAIFKGDCMYMDMDADAAADVHYALPTVSVDGSNILYTYPNLGSNGPSVVPYDGGTFSLFGADATRNGVHLYAGARIVKVTTDNPLGRYPFNVPDIRIFLEPNSAFNVGDTIMDPHFNSQNITALDMTTYQMIAPNGQSVPSGMWTRFYGKGISGGATGWTLDNHGQTTLYKPFGGVLSEPTAVRSIGAFDKIWTGDYTPLTSLISFTGHQPGQTSYDIFNDPWGSLSLDDTSTFHINNAGLTVQNSFGAGALVTAGQGMSSGAGDGAGNNAGLKFNYTATGVAPVWLAPCETDGFLGHNADLCVTSQGASRSSTVAAADRGLEASVLSGVTSVNTNLLNPTSGTFIDVGGTGGVNYTLGFGENFGADAIDLYHSSTTADRLGMGLASNEMQFYVAAPGQHFSFDAGPSGIQPTGTNEFFRMQPSTSGGGFTVASGEGLCFSNSTTSSATADTCLWRDSAGVLDVGNGTAGNASGTIKAANISSGVYQGPATAPTGACSNVGWAFSQDGHISYCDGSAWALKM